MGKSEIIQPNSSTRRFETLPRVFKFANRKKVIYTPPRGDGNISFDYMKSQIENEGFYPDELRLKEILSQGITMLVPREYLHGRQTNDSYSKKKRSLVEKNLEERGLDFLLSDPIITCALPVQNGLQIIIIDGHNRARYSSSFGINDIPSLIYSPQQLVDAFNLRNSIHFDVDTLTEQLGTDVAEAYSSFRNLPDRKFPKIVVGCNNMQDLPFKRF